MNDTFDTYMDTCEEKNEQTIAPVTPSVLDENEKKLTRFCVYIGPTITGLITAQQVLRGTKEDALRQADTAVKQYPQYVPRLMIPDGELPQARLQVRQKGTLLHTTYQKFLQILKGGNGNV